MSIKQPGNEIDARELALFTINTEALYRQRAQPIMANLRRKIARGVYDPTLALKLWRYLADAGARQYAAEFGPCYFTPATRDMAAAEIADHYADELAES